MAKHEIRIDRSVALGAEPTTGHNRWHPDITPVVTCEPGDEVEIETRDAFDLQFHPGATLTDVANVDLNLVHPLTGPVFVEGAEPGDLLVVDVLEVVPAQSSSRRRRASSASSAQGERVSRQARGRRMQ